jgi:hypothetical protein
MDLRSFPKTRAEGLIVEELDDEVLVYDIDRNRAHCLNSTAGRIWKLCNGRRTVGDIARQLDTEIHKREGITRLEHDIHNIVATEELVWLALAQLSRDHLLAEELPAPRITSISRREALRRVGIGAAIAVPIVASITAPTAVQAGTCGHTNSNCTTGAECCSGICNGGKCT